MEVLVWVLGACVVALVVLILALLIRRPGAGVDLKGASEYLLTLAEERLKAAAHAGTADLDTKKQLIDQQLQAVNAELAKITALVHNVEKERKGSFGELTTHIKTLGQQAVNLTSSTSTLREALSSPRMRGQWGERIADDVLRLAGFIDGVNYHRQVTVEGEGSRPDYVFLLPKGLHLNMDCKFPLDNYLKALEATQDAERDRHEKAFLRDVRNRVREITNREYIDPEGGTVDCVLLFVPNDAVFAHVYEADPSLLDYALQNRVVCCSPLTLFAVLAVVRQAVDSFALYKASDELLSHFGRFKAEWVKFVSALKVLGDRLTSTQRAYEQLTGPRRRQLERPLMRLESLRQERGLEPALSDETSLLDITELEEGNGSEEEPS